MPHSPYSRRQSLRVFTILYIAIGVLELISNLTFDQWPEFHYVAKPMIMISLSVYYFVQTWHRRDRVHYLIQGALLASLMGDIFLMFDTQTAFMSGLGSFFLAQLCYIGAFSKLDKVPDEGYLLGRKVWLVLPFLLYAIGLILLIWQEIGPMLIPVCAYALVLMLMVLMALNRWKGVPEDSFSFVFLGALLFMLSDSMIALNRFGSEVLPIPLAQLWIMLTYISAQYLILVGMLKQYWAPKTQIPELN